MNVSVVVASYNGEKYIKQQLDSIILQLDNKDEVIVSDDGSTDRTMHLLKEYEGNYSSITILNGPQKGLASNFENAILHASNEIVMICDQDDYWYPNRIHLIKQKFIEHPEINVILNNADYIDAYGNKLEGFLFEKRNAKHGYFRNVIYSTYYGCCMAVKHDFIKDSLPFPKGVLYDQYLGALAEKRNSSLFVNAVLVSHRVHDSNWSQEQNIANQIKYRIRLLKNTF